jgi:hypothetical protein
MMPTTKPQRSTDELTVANHNMLCQLVSMTRRKQSTIKLTKAQTKRIFQALHTITLYLHQPEGVRFGQIERILSVRDMLEWEYEDQLKEPIDEPAKTQKPGKSN